MDQSTQLGQVTIIKPNLTETLQVWGWLAWRSLLLGGLAGMAWGLVEEWVFPAAYKQVMGSTGAMLLGVLCGIYMVQRLFTHGKFRHFTPALIRG